MSAPPPTGQVVGNPDAAQELYGLGVRVGFYLQIFGMTLGLHSHPESNRKGLIASGSVAASVLVSWFAYAALGRFSPSEAILVLAVLIFLSFPAKASLMNARMIAGETVGLVLMLLVELVTCAALLWTFAVLVRTLPGLNTANIIWLVVCPVATDGWFRYVALVYLALDAATSLVLAVKVVRLVRLDWDRHRNGKSMDDQAALKDISEIINWNGVSPVIHIMLWLSLGIYIIIIELTVHKNGLSPSNDLQAPGQLVPLVTGIIILVDSVFDLRHRFTPHARRQLPEPTQLAQVTCGSGSSMSSPTEARSRSAETGGRPTSAVDGTGYSGDARVGSMGVLNSRDPALEEALQTDGAQGTQFVP